ncbi:MAG: sulfotransferase, partial [Candidatus Latescibacterota bacterium]
MLDVHPESSCLFQPGILRLHFGKKTPGRAITRATASPYAGVFANPTAEERYASRISLLKKARFLTSSFLNGYSDSLDGEMVEIHRAMVRSAVTTFLNETSDKPVKGFKQHTDIDFLIELFPDARVIVIVRDGRDVSVSMRHHRMRQGVYYVGDERWPFLTTLNRLELSRRAMKFAADRSKKFRDFV